MSSTVPDATSPDPDAAPTGDPMTPAPDDAPTPPRTRREAALAAGWAEPDQGSWRTALVAVGILSVVLGILVLAWPSATLLVVAITFGLQLIIAGAVRLALSRDLPREPGWLRPLSMALGVLSVVAGVICLFRPGTSLLVIAIFIAVGWVAEGIAAIAHGFGSDRSTGAKVFLVVCGVIGVLAGLAVAIFPGSSLVLLTRLAGILLVVVGVADLVTVFLSRRAAGAAGPSTPTAAPPAPPAAPA
ncbi:HdeD family acid-resistance protein [Intrasporangium flavum]|uniref:HdeD family acid-resistance protein n=1 Tax=Intrasporangium flavum TaxID=1428657 RepID=UPI00096D30A2|nr:DUF308 domain-containing protein [Intrasporangium flavum]